MDVWIVFDLVDGFLIQVEQGDTFFVRITHQVYSTCLCAYFIDAFGTLRTTVHLSIGIWALVFSGAAHFAILRAIFFLATDVAAHDLTIRTWLAILCGAIVNVSPITWFDTSILFTLVAADKTFYASCIRGSFLEKDIID